MLAVTECDAKVAEMVLLAAECPIADGRAEYLKLAMEWRGVRVQARWQERHPQAPQP